MSDFLDTVIHSVIQKIAIALTLSVAGYSGLACQVQTSTPVSVAASASAGVGVIPPQSAIIESAMMPLPVFTTSTATSTSSTAIEVTNIIPDLLPLVKLPPFQLTATSTVTSTIILKPTKTITIEKITTPATKPITKPVTAPVVNAAPPTPMVIPLTAQALLDQTTVSLSHNLDGSEQLAFVTNAGTAGKITWGLTSTAIGGGTNATNSTIPPFTISSSCTPQPAPAIPSATNQNPSLSVRTSYDCTVSATPQSGNDQRTVSKNFSFTTDPGQLIASVAAETDSLLQNNTNNGGFAFDNQDNQPATITALTVDISYTGVVTSTDLLVLRFADPVTGVSLYDYPLATAAAGGSATDVSIPLSFTIPGNTQKVLPVEAIGVSILAVDGTSPTIDVTLRGVTVSDGIATKFIAPQISWTCIVPNAAYDPYATSSPFLSDQACGN